MEGRMGFTGLRVVDQLRTKIIIIFKNKNIMFLKRLIHYYKKELFIFENMSGIKLMQIHHSFMTQLSVDDLDIV